MILTFTLDQLRGCLDQLHGLIGFPCLHNLLVHPPRCRPLPFLPRLWIIQRNAKVPEPVQFDQRRSHWTISCEHFGQAVEDALKGALIRSVVNSGSLRKFDLLPFSLTELVLFLATL